jgi:subtilisin family serine protease
MRLLAGLGAALLLGLAACGSPPAVLPSVPADSTAMRDRPERLIVVAVDNPRGASSGAAGSTIGNYASLQQYVAGPSARHDLEALKRAHGLREVTAWPIPSLRLHCVVLEVPEHRSRDEVIAALQRDARVQLAQPLQTFSGLSDAGVSYNDPYASLQHGLVQVEAAKAHAMSRGSGVQIALVDTGVDTAHPDLRGRIATTRNLVDRDDQAFLRDRHGTEVAGVIAAVANNALGIVGVAPEATLRVYKACWQRASAEGGGARCNSFTLAQALSASIDDGAPIINLSLGGPADELLSRLVLHAIKLGRIVVAAVPPSGELGGFPVGVPGVIVVDSIGRPERPGVLKAPGQSVLTLVPGGHYDFANGSSLAAAHVTGVVALLLAGQMPPAPDRLHALLESSRAHNRPGSSISACSAIASLPQSSGCALDVKPASLAQSKRSVP